jgi:hypothetical protein
MRGPLALLALGATLATASIATATHQWGSYHWQRSSNAVLALTVGDNHIPVSPAHWSAILGDVVASWDLFGGAYLAFEPVPGGTGDIESYNDDYGNTGWLDSRRSR